MIEPIEDQAKRADRAGRRNTCVYVHAQDPFLVWWHVGPVFVREGRMNEPTGEWDALPIMLTIDEAARVLRIGRSKAYEMAGTYTSSGGMHGLACLRLGDLLRVPKFALHEYVTTGHIVQLIPQHVPHHDVNATVDATAVRTPARKARATDRAQLSLLGTD